MAHYDHLQAPGLVNSPPRQAAEGYVHLSAPSPIGYITKADTAGCPHHHHPFENRSKGNDLWKRCFAAFCCCWLDQFRSLIFIICIDRPLKQKSKCNCVRVDM
ncbi:uncharacterized protein LOC116113272 [Pistacia vera]|uniref:uncharacterized protein LOC116113272 n=1 Tax=Pistacia vera TaxID=55513 RepID=UPI0012631157|nr:uncharacterized protein LOC116113272 [Pistacia vera]